MSVAQRWQVVLQRGLPMKLYWTSSQPDWTISSVLDLQSPLRAEALHGNQYPAWLACRQVPTWRAVLQFGRCLIVREFQRDAIPRQLPSIANEQIPIRVGLSAHSIEALKVDSIVTHFATRFHGAEDMLV
jgi:hypothetical protein